MSEGKAGTPGTQTEGPAKWARPLVKLDAIWTKVETYMVLALLILAIFYMAGWVTLNAFHTKGGKLAKFPGIIATFGGLASAAAWGMRKDRKPKELLVPGIFTVLGIVLLLVSKRGDYFANVARWLSDASVIRLMGTPQIVSARLFTIWVALLGASLATGSGRQINIDVVMRFIGPKPRLAVALLGYAIAAVSCYVVAWGFLDYLAITRFGASKEMKPGEKLSIITKANSRHFFLLRRQIVFDFRSFKNVVLQGKPFDKWYTGAEWNAEVNENGWTDAYPQPPMANPLPPGAPPVPSKPCLSPKELEELGSKGGSLNPDWRLPGVCDLSDGTVTRPPLATAPEPDDRTPLEADLSLLFAWGFFVIGCRFLLRGALALGGAVSTDPNAAHGAEPTHEVPAGDPPVAEKVDGGLVAVHPPIVETKVDQEAKAHEGEASLPSDDIAVGDALAASHEKVEAGAIDADNEAKHRGGEPAHHVVEDTEAPRKAEGVPTPLRVEAAEKAAKDEESDRTVVGDLSELTKAELREAQKKKDEESK